MQAINRITVLTTFAVLSTAAFSTSQANACDRGGSFGYSSYQRSSSYGYGNGYGNGYGSGYGYGGYSQYGYRPSFQPSRIPQTVNPGFAPSQFNTPSAQFAPSQQRAPFAPPSNLPPAPVVNPNNFQVRGAGPLATTNPPVNPNQAQPRAIAP